MHCKQWIFDMDGTLTDSMEVVWRSAPEAILARFGRTPKPGLHETLLSMDLRDSPAYIIKEYDLPIGIEEYYRQLRIVVPELYRRVELKPGVREMLARLREEGVRLCICSNTWAEICEEVLTRLGVADAFEFFITAQGEKSKAHPDVFFEAMERLGGGNPSVCAVCEDSLYAASTARDAGFYVVGIADKCSRADETALRAVSDQFLAEWKDLDWEKA